MVFAIRDGARGYMGVLSPSSFLVFLGLLCLLSLSSPPPSSQNLPLQSADPFGLADAALTHGGPCLKEVFTGRLQRPLLLFRLFPSSSLLLFLHFPFPNHPEIKQADLGTVL